MSSSSSSSAEHLALLLILAVLPTLTHSLCRNFCGNMPVKYPFGIDDGCGAPQFNKMLNCSTDLFFQTPSGTYKVQSIDYDKKTMVSFCWMSVNHFHLTIVSNHTSRESAAFCENMLQYYKCIKYIYILTLYLMMFVGTLSLLCLSALFFPTL